MYQLNKSMLLGRGAHRECYEHPDNNNLCIKVIYSADTGGAKEIDREMKLYKSLENRLVDWSGITRFHGNVNTNLGIGYVYERVKNIDNTKSETLESYLKSSPPIEPLINALEELYSYMLDNKIPTMTIKAKNVVCKKISSSKVKLIIVDNLGDSTWLPISKYSKYLFKRRFDRKWGIFIKSLNIDSNSLLKVGLLVKRPE